MRRLLIAVPFVLMACAGSGETKADAPAAAMAVSLTEADVAGTWQGTATMAGSDSVILHWTQVCAVGSCRETSQEAPDTILSTYTLSADSVIGISAAAPNPQAGGIMTVDHWVVRISGNQVSGRGWTVLADKPDSVVMRVTISGSRVP